MKSKQLSSLIIAVLLFASTGCGGTSKAMVGGLGGAAAGVIAGQEIEHNTEAALISAGARRIHFRQQNR